jgi:multidrug efflux pump subunit AcrA (membrane-fusion protein)
MKNYLSKKVIIVSAVIVALTIFAFNRWGTSGPQAERTIGLVKKQDIIQRVTIAGSVVPFRKTILTAPYTGYLKTIFVKTGDLVKKGDPLATIVQSLQSGEDAFPLRSPLNGTVVQVNKNEGEYVKEGDVKDFILRIDDSSKLFISANAPEIDRVKIKLGQEAVINASAVLGRKYKGIIRDLSLAANDKESYSRNQVVEFPIKIEITDSDDIIKSGMSVVIDIISSKKEKVLVLRHEFVHQENETYFVILKSNERRNIQVGIQNEEVFEIVAGLQEGEAVKQVDFAEASAD